MTATVSARMHASAFTRQASKSTWPSQPGFVSRVFDAGVVPAVFGGDPGAARMALLLLRTGCCAVRSGVYAAFQTGSEPGFNARAWLASRAGICPRSGIQKQIQIKAVRHEVPEVMIE